MSVQNNLSYRMAMGAHGRNDIATPRDLYNLLSEKLGPFDPWDPCPLGGEYDPNVEDGLAIEWSNCTFVNPPYRGIKDWLQKGIEEAGKRKKIVFLIPFRANSRYWVCMLTNG